MSKINRASLRAIRERTGVSYRELATQTGLSAGYLADIESGRRHPPHDTIKSIAAALAVPVTALLIAEPEEVGA